MAERWSLFDDRDRADADRFRAVIEWLQENTPGALALCPYKVESMLPRAAKGAS